MGKAYWFVVLLVLVSGLVASWYVADQSQNSLLLSPQKMESPVILEPFVFENLDQLDWFFLAPEPQNQVHWQFTQKLAEQLSAKGWKLVVDPYFSEQTGFMGDFQLGILQNRDSYFQKIKERFPSEKIAVLLPNITITQIISDSILTTTKLKNTRTLSFLSYPSSREEESQYFLPCSESRDLKTGPSELGCYVRQQSRSHYKVLSNQKSPAGFLLKFNSSELVLFLR